MKKANKGTDMEKYVTSIKDLVIQVLTNGSEIKVKAESGDALSCFQMGMIYMLGINTQVDFKKASSFFKKQSLADDPDACRLLGFIGECEGNYSLAFNYYANAAGSKSKLPYLNKVFEERNNLQGFFKKLVSPNVVLNHVISSTINEYLKGGYAKVDATIKIATLCDDEITCFEAAQSLYDAGDLYSAKKWLQYGNVANTNELFVAIENKLSDSRNALKLPDVLQIIDIKGNSLLAELNLSSSSFSIKNSCDDVSVSCKKTWMKEVSNLIYNIGKILEEEAARLKKLREEEEAARLKKLREEEEAARLKKLREEEERRKKQQEDAKRKRMLELAEAQIRKKKKATTIVNIVLLIIFIPWGLLWLIAFIASANWDSGIVSNIFAVILFLFIFAIIPCGILKLLSIFIIKKL